MNALETPRAAAHANPARPVVEAFGVCKSYGIGGRAHRGDRVSDGTVTHALSQVSFSVHRGEFVGLMGPSGSGKSTLLNVVSTIDVPTAGTIRVNGRDITQLTGHDLERFRRDELGFVFQDANLLDTLTGFENIALALTVQKVPAREIPARVQAVAHQLGIAEVLDKHPYQMSGGQRQRIAAARATIANPALLLADEPTGALDSKAARQLMEAFSLLNQAGATILMVTHDAMTASYCSRILFLRDGRLQGELSSRGQTRETFHRSILNVAASLEEDAAKEARHAG